MNLIYTNPIVNFITATSLYSFPFMLNTYLWFPMQSTLLNVSFKSAKLFHLLLFTTLLHNCNAVLDAGYYDGDENDIVDMAI